VLVGVLVYVARWNNEIRIIDIALLPEHLNRGIGTQLISELLAEAASAGLPVTIHVKSSNPARHLYERLGFQLAEDLGVYYLMNWTPKTASDAESASGGRFCGV
jgi:ribosomal protein S18 acetylase RimI-like enzyme